MAKAVKHPEAGKLWLVPVPIGNLGDITLRALEVLKSVSLIAAEDTRNARFLLTRYEIPAPRLISFHKFNERSREDSLIQHLMAGQDLAVISDAGTPGLSDPAMELVASAISKGFEVIALPGASALLPALTASGLNRGPFLFLGFLPTQRKTRQQALSKIRDSIYTVVLYEAPHRIFELLNELWEQCGNRMISLGRELTKLHEEHIRGDLETLREPGSFNPKGEFVLVIEGAEPAQQCSEAQIHELAQLLVDEGIAINPAAKILSRAYGLKRNQAYQFLLDLQRQRHTE